MITPHDIDKAAKRINPHILRTPLLHSRWLSNLCKGDVLLKLENEQYTGSFKARGSLNKLMWLQQQGNDKLPVTASTGNHGLGFARALDLLGIQGKIFLPHNAVSSKVKAIETFNADIEFYGNDPYATEVHARKIAEKNDWIYVSPYNDKQVIAGQGTIAKEIGTQIKSTDNVLATVGGGGLISGVGIYFKEIWPETQLIGCQPVNSPEMSVSVQAGEYQKVESKTTLSDGSAGGFERNSITFALCKQFVDRFLLISENEIKNAIRMMIKHHSKLIEGAAAVAVASVLKKPEQFTDQTTIVIVCGANISLQKLHHII